MEEGEPAGGVEPVGDVEVRGAHLHGVTISGSLTVRCIDELPIIAVLASQADGDTVIRDAGELRNKEIRPHRHARDRTPRCSVCPARAAADVLTIHGPVAAARRPSRRGG